MDRNTYTKYTVNDETFHVQKDFLASEPDLVCLITTCERLRSEPHKCFGDGQPIDGRQFWLCLYPIINPDKQARFRKIMQNEATQLHLLDLKFGRITL